MDKTGMLIRDDKGNFVPLLKVDVRYWVGGRGYKYLPMFYPETEPGTRFDEYEIYQLRQEGLVCSADQVVTIEYAA